MTEDKRSETIRRQVATIQVFLELFDGPFKSMARAQMDQAGVTPRLDAMRTLDPLNYVVGHAEEAAKCLMEDHLTEIETAAAQLRGQIEAVVSRGLQSNEIRIVQEAANLRTLNVQLKRFGAHLSPEHVFDRFVATVVEPIRAEVTKASLRAALVQHATEVAKSQRFAAAALMLSSEAVASAERHAKAAREGADAAAKASGVTAANAQATRHEELAKGARKAANRWLWGIVATTLFSLSAVLIASPRSLGPTTTALALIATIIVSLGPKLVALSLCFFALSFCVKNYRANTHIAVINEHRKAVFQSYEAFANGSADSKTKDLVLTQTFQLVVAQQPTGYLPSEPDALPVSQATELLKELSKLKESK